MTRADQCDASDYDVYEINTEKLEQVLNSKRDILINEQEQNSLATNAGSIVPFSSPGDGLYRPADSKGRETVKRRKNKKFRQGI
ncbi:hypothetical protein M5689_014460 [Euphorbia peplus]|nr:hypothetical protein M5689_014460 [Euphorbia peplus]